ncbi:LacI family DNA-binding transcriptional regulator [Sediminibacterium goheungense]|uniref:LacI family transcriptional regulator n=1 Tax=Sediminibacterium goheungense TaxID=1086393 RepID=A0A4R6J200_9BACT|nr:LacI family DNA-binding transcriptional regulator [Sediminibacterium goheungense]TDO28791.1 LacI family transcriptional regulator [Sediminibacterium goheungense]
MKYEAVTIKDIARELGLSTSTVSRALRDSYEISPETKKLVLEYAEKINYRPNPIALSLKEKRTRSIGIVVAEIANSFFSQIINGIESIAYDKGYNVIITQSHESFERELINVQYLASRSIDGLLISLASETRDLSHLKHLHERGYPIVFFDRIVDEINTHKVIVDNTKGGYDATTHLIKSGFKNIAALANAAYLSITRDRIGGYQAALEEHKMKQDPSLIKYCLHGGLVYEEVEQALDSLFKQKKKPDAIFAAADKLTTNCLRYFKAKGIRVPEDIAVIGFSNIDLTELLSPSLSVVRQPAFEMGQVATELLLNLIESKRPVKDFDTRMLQPDLFIRESTSRKNSSL